MTPLLPYSLLQRFLFRLPPEQAHEWAMTALELRKTVCGCRPPPSRAGRQVMGLSFANPIGLAAGFDKNGAHVDALANLGFGFIEIGGITPRPQAGTPPPRLFRLPAAQALINRMGFNNVGAEQAARNLSNRRYRGMVGVNLGKNADTADEHMADDYLGVLTTLYPHGDFFTVNISSPNTGGLRDWQQADRLSGLLAAITQKRDELAETHQRRAPLTVKIAPDLSDDDVSAVAAVIADARCDAVTACNTTTDRPPSISALPHGDEHGGLSGKPLKARATEVIRRLRAALPPEVAIIGVGGIFSAADADEKFAAGANLVQLYSGLIYQGPQLPMDILRELKTTETD